jgi:hypothetical protein
MSAEMLSMFAGVLLSLSFAYAPGLKGWYAALPGTHKRLVMLAALFLVVLGLFGLSCAGWLALLGFSFSITCDVAGALGLLRLLFLAAFANQSTFLLSPKPARR